MLKVGGGLWERRRGHGVLGRRGLLFGRLGLLLLLEVRLGTRIGRVDLLWGRAVSDAGLL